jgi:hypothetical protein
MVVVAGYNVADNGLAIARTNKTARSRTGAAHTKRRSEVVPTEGDMVCVQVEGTSGVIFATVSV